MADNEITKRKEEAEREDEERQQGNAARRRDTGQKGDTAGQGQSPLQNKINALQSAVGRFEAYFNSFTIVGGDGVEVSGNLITGFTINKR